MNLCTGAVAVAPRRVAMPYGAPRRSMRIGSTAIMPCTWKYCATFNGINATVPSLARSNDSPIGTKRYRAPRLTIEHRLQALSLGMMRGA